MVNCVSPVIHNAPEEAITILSCLKRSIDLPFFSLCVICLFLRCLFVVGFFFFFAGVLGGRGWGEVRRSSTVEHLLMV